MSILSFRRELVEQCFDEMLPLLRAQYEELATFKDIPLAPSRETYDELENAGRLRCYVARKAGAIVGYAAFFVSFNAHYATSWQAVNDVIYVAPEHRREGLGRWLVEFAEGSLRPEGVDTITFHAKLAHPELSKMLEDMGYPATEVLHTKRL